MVRWRSRWLWKRSRRRAASPRGGAPGDDDHLRNVLTLPDVDCPVPEVGRMIQGGERRPCGRSRVLTARARRGLIIGLSAVLGYHFRHQLPHPRVLLQAVEPVGFAVVHATPLRHQPCTDPADQDARGPPAGRRAGQWPRKLRPPAQLKPRARRTTGPASQAKHPQPRRPREIRFSLRYGKNGHPAGMAAARAQSPSSVRSAVTMSQRDSPRVRCAMSREQHSKISSG